MRVLDKGPSELHWPLFVTYLKVVLYFVVGLHLMFFGYGLLGSIIRVVVLWDWTSVLDDTLLGISMDVLFSFLKEFSVRERYPREVAAVGGGGCLTSGRGVW